MPKMVVFVQTPRPPETLENLVPQTLGKTIFDFSRFWPLLKSGGWCKPQHW
jgi:hypothetical protein